jgi:hypothetical protein
MNAQEVNQNETAMPQGLVALDVPIPSNLERALGYAKADVNPELVRYVAFWWAESDDLAYCDGHALVIGATWAAWSAYRSHRAVARALAGWDFGDVGEPGGAQLCFVLDRAKRAAYACPKARAMQIVREQWSHLPRPGEARAAADSAENGPGPVTSAELRDLLKVVLSGPAPAITGPHARSPFGEDGATSDPLSDEIKTRLEAEHREHDAMLAELDAADPKKTHKSC